MITLVIGGSGSGKSSFAEGLVVDKYHEYENALSGSCGSVEKSYIATMMVYDEEGQKKVERHRIMRADKGFSTIEAPRNVRLACEETCDFNNENIRIGLLECMSNLVANEMFSDEGIIDRESVVCKVSGDVAELGRVFDELIIVSNNIFDDGIDYDDTTKEYIRAMGEINQRIGAVADKVYEVVVGIPITVK